MKPKQQKRNDPDQDEIIKSLYELGFEIGYFGHSEEGWVTRKYTEIIEQARKIGIEELEDQYQTAKQDGIEKRRSDIIKGLSGKSETSDKSKEKVSIENSQFDTGTEEKVSPGKRSGSIIFCSPITEPVLNSKPKNLRKIKCVNLPKLLR